MKLSFAEYTVTLAPTSLPAELQNLASTGLENSFSPGDIRITWDAANSGEEIFTRIPINHHVGGPTFSECAAPISAGEMLIAKEYVEPLAVSTGLEFQGVEAMNRAAAETPLGCIEFRFQKKYFQL